MFKNTVFLSRGAYNLIERLRQAAKEFNLVQTVAREKAGRNKVQARASRPVESIEEGILMEAAPETES